MRPATRRDPRAVRIRFFAVGIYLTVAATPTAFGQTPGVLPDVLYTGLGASDKVLVDATLQKTLETRRVQETTEWRSVATGNSGTITPLRTFRVKGGFFCRDFRETLLTTDTLAKRVGTACRQKDGGWIRVER